MELNLGRRSILRPHRASAVLGGNDDHDWELCPCCQETTPNFYLVLS